MNSIRRTPLNLVTAAMLAMAVGSVPAAHVFAQRNQGGHGRQGGGHDRGGARVDARVDVRVQQPRARVRVVQPRASVRVVRQPRQRVVYVQPAPPAPRVVVVPRQRAHAVWVEGYWQWNGRRYVWAPGHWEAERGGHRHVQAHWEQRGVEWTLVPATWVVITN